MHLLKNKTFPIQSNDEFLKVCNLEKKSQEAVFALRIRRLLSGYLGSKGINKTEQLFASHKIESDLNINHLDSIDLIELISFLDIEGLFISEKEGYELFILNKEDSTVAEIISKIIDITKDQKDNKSVLLDAQESRSKDRSCALPEINEQ
jgi:hypothetical protein